MPQVWARNKKSLKEGKIKEEMMIKIIGKELKDPPEPTIKP